MFPLGQFHEARTKNENEAMRQYDRSTDSKKLVCFNLYSFLLILFLSLQTANSNTTNMNRKSDKVKNDMKVQNDQPNEDYEEQDKYIKVNFDKNPFYNNEEFPHNFYEHERNGYSDYGDYKRYYLNPSNPLPKSSVKFKISSRIVQTKYGKLQGIVLAMDEQRYLSPLEVFLGVPYATPPVGSNR